VIVITIGDVYINGVTINDLYNGEGFGVIFFKVVGFSLFCGFGSPLPLTPDRAVVEQDKQCCQQQAQGDYAGSPASAHRINGFVFFSQ